jgi:hypothetical protein
MKKGLIFLFGISLIMGFSLASMQDDSTLWGTVLAYRLNVRSGPGTEYSVITKVNRGEGYYVTGRSDDQQWLLLDLEETDGWVSARYVNLTDDLPMPTLVPTSTTCAYPTHMSPNCPSSQESVQFSMQPFEGGMMVWRGDVRHIYILYDTSFMDYVEDTWAGETLPQETPPKGLLQPQMGFGKVWSERAGVRRLLGWATAPETSYTSLVEFDSGLYPGPSDNATIFQLPDGRVVGIQFYISNHWWYLDELTRQ